MARPVSARVLQAFLGFIELFGVLVPGLWAQTNVQGQWSTLSGSMPINPIHTALLHNGKILVVAGSGNCPPSMSGCPTGPPYGPANGSGAVLFDPTTGTFASFTLSWDMFCNGMLVLPDGRTFINGGSQAYDPFLGQPKSAVFDPATNTFTDVQNMAHGRWYPTVTTLGDGRVMTFSGQDETSATNNAVEIYTVGSGWSTQYIAPFTPPLYPRMHLLPNGKVFYSGSGTTSMLFDPVALSWTTMATTIYSGTRTYGTSVLLPLTPANSYDPRVMIMGGGSPATSTTEIIDLGASNPVWQSGPSMSQGRIEMNAVILPNGKILAVGGSVNDEDASTASLNADLYDPASNSFSSAGANTYPRLYHSVALLLPDATVWFAGGNPQRGSYESHMEIYRPGYLFNSNGTSATLPTISGAPATISWNGTFTVSTPDAVSISSVVLVRPGAPTHAFDMEQRLVDLSFTTGSGTLSVTAPPNGNIAPPGYYMLFLLNSSGVPSVAKFVQLGASGSAPAPTVSAIAPSSGSSNGGTSVNLTGTGFQTGATVKLGGTAAASVTVVNSASITATTAAHAAGAVNVLVTNPNGQNGTLTNGYTYTNPAPTVSSLTPNSGTANGGTGVTIAGTGFLAGATVKLGGTAATNVSVLSGASISATTSAHAAGAVNVVVTNTDGQSGSAANGYTYTSSLGLTVSPDDPSSVSLTAGQAANYILSLGGNGASGTASLSCSVSPTPRGASCSVPATVTFASTASTTFNVSVTTTSSAVAALRPSVSPRAPWSWTLAMAMLGLVILPGVRVSKRSQRRYQYLWLAPLTLCLLLMSCGGGSVGGGNNGGQHTNPNTTAPGTYTLTVHATSGSTTETIPLTLIVH
jgi:Galactose oxidase-like, Early set domain/IPT/TIG domain/Glyoxal oxidase N-terminus